MNDTRTLLYSWILENGEPDEAAVYNDSSLRDIFKYLGMKSTKSLESFGLYGDALVVLYEPSDIERSFLEKNSSVLTKVAEFEGKGRLGSDIEVYRYSKPVTNKINTGGCGCGR